MIDGAAAGGAPYDGDAAVSGFGYGYLGEDVLKASTDHGGRVAPDEENVIFCDMVKNVFLKGLVPGRIQ